MPLRDARTAARSRRKPIQRGPSMLALLGTGFALVALLIASGWYYLKSEQLHVAVDTESLCPVERPPSEITVILLDVSDSVSEPQLIQVQHALARVRNAIPRFGLVEVYVIDPQAQHVSRPVVHVCNPGTGEDMSRIYQNPKLAKQRWETGFKERLDAELTRLLKAPESPASPIYEAIQSTALWTLGKPEYDEVPKHLVVVSDLLQHVPNKQTHYRGVPDFEAFRASPYFADIRASLQYVQVTLLYLNRSDIQTQGLDHIRFWEQYFAAQGATVREVERIFGDR